VLCGNAGATVQWDNKVKIKKMYNFAAKYGVPETKKIGKTK